jgi:phosphoenolpyruvate carboxylase
MADQQDRERTAAQVRLLKTDLAIHDDYARLAPEAVREAVLPSIRAEHDRTVAALLRLRGADRLLEGDPGLREVLALRDPYLDPPHVIQAALLERLSPGDEAKDARRQEWAEDTALLEEAFLLATNGIAAGLRNTG